LVLWTAIVGYYVVLKGRVPGIYLSWQECSKHVLHFRRAIHKRYVTYDEAVAAYNAAHPTAPPEIIPYAQIGMSVGDATPDAAIEMPACHDAPAAEIGVSGVDAYLCCYMRLLCLSCAFFFSSQWFKMTFFRPVMTKCMKRDELLFFILTSGLLCAL
jgi:hypothetical protein